MKTKTITKEFYVSDGAINELQNPLIEAFTRNLFKTRQMDYRNKITISFEVPEKTITISESEFDEKLLSLINRFTLDDKRILKERFFGE